MPSGSPSDSPVLVSACLVGVRCRYDGEPGESVVVSRLEGARAIPVCPEQLGGLPTPRAACEVVRDSGETGTGDDVLAGSARVVDREGTDRTVNFLRGAREVLAIARLLGARRAILRSGSPSCDVAKGVTASLLRGEGFELEAAG